MERSIDCTVISREPSHPGLQWHHVENAVREQFATGISLAGCDDNPPTLSVELDSIRYGGDETGKAVFDELHSPLMYDATSDTVRIGVKGLLPEPPRSVDELPADFNDMILGGILHELGHRRDRAQILRFRARSNWGMNGLGKIALLVALIPGAFGAGHPIRLLSSVVAVVLVLSAAGVWDKLIFPRSLMKQKVLWENGADDYMLSVGGPQVSGALLRGVANVEASSTVSANVVVPHGTAAERRARLRL